MKILGISAGFHDAAAALVVDSQIVAAAQEERFTRLKHDRALPVEATRFCLEQAGLSIESIDHVVFYEKPLRKFERLLVGQLREFPRSRPLFSRSMISWLSDRLWLKSKLIKTLGCAESQLLFCEHHLSHAASAFLTSPFEEAAVLTVDGVGEWATTSLFHGRSSEEGSQLELIEEQRYPDSIGLLYSAITAFLGFQVNEGEYKVMGLAAYGKPSYAEAFEQLCTIEQDASLRLDMRYFAFQRHPERSFSKALEQLLGPARAPGAELQPHHADIAATLQALTERYLLALAERAKEKTGATQLALAGGVALNAVANHHLLTKGPFRSIFVHPAAGDAGAALGAALWATHVVHRAPRAAPPRNLFLGQGYEKAEVRSFLEDCGVDYQAMPTSEALFQETARRLAQGEVGGWFQGRFEWGPRALGGRSIIADPRDPRTRDRVNQKIKFREEFRPFAPAVLAEERDRWFEFPEDREEHMSPFMCCVAKATSEGAQTLGAVVHENGTARVQSVHKDNNPTFHGLLSEFKARTGVGVLLNTSMNLKDEPMVASPCEAYATFIRSDLDFLVLEDCLIEKRQS